ncbi:hypothetical protein [Streptomyces sp. DASNCL29]|uniref:hypothetical protein n=1 Tax=Streptomyces sp. DASNCL29 TaxID=2583819 RepID=UPI00110F8D49|nr:hypothetical protein [Streptomyces sp. DASNCL29]TMU93415.1 hypothetical protein FGK60_28720 [Streptomyces sp. DASNCL29]
MTGTGDAVLLAGLAAAQGGVVLTAQAPAGGWKRGRLNRRFRAEGWTQLRAGVWAEPGRGVDPMALLWANQLAHPHLVVSHTAAAVPHDIETRAQRVEFTGPPQGRTDVRGGVLHRLPLGADETTTVGGLRVTTVVRTMADLLRAGPRDDALAAVESAVSRRSSRYGGGERRRAPLTTLGEIARALERGSALRGTATAREWLALADPKAGSPAETIARLRMHDAGLHPESQVLLTTPMSRRGVPGLLPPGAGAGGGDRKPCGMPPGRWGAQGVCENAEVLEAPLGPAGRTMEVWEEVSQWWKSRRSRSRTSGVTFPEAISRPSI